MTYKIIGKYIKDLKFKIPHPKTFFSLSKNISNYKINVDIKSSQIKQNIIEILTSINLSQIKDDSDKVEANVVYAAIIELDQNKIKNDEIEKIILIKIPNEVYPELRSIFIYLFENSGFKDVKINEAINFEELYNQKKNQ